MRLKTNQVETYRVQISYNTSTVYAYRSSSEGELEDLLGRLFT